MVGGSSDQEYFHFNQRLIVLRWTLYDRYIEVGLN